MNSDELSDTEQFFALETTPTRSGFIRFIENGLRYILTEQRDSLEDGLQNGSCTFFDLTEEFELYDIEDSQCHLHIGLVQGIEDVEVLQLEIKRYRVVETTSGEPLFVWYPKGIYAQRLDLQLTLKPGYHRYGYNLHLRDLKTGNPFPDSLDPYREIALAVLKLKNHLLHCQS